METIAHIRTGFSEKFGIPRQSGLVPAAKGRIFFEKQYRNPDAIRGIEEFSHLWLIWGFSANKEKKSSLLVNPPRLGGREKRGVFATRSPFRPNGLGLSSVVIEKIEIDKKYGPVIWVSGVDMLDNTPIYDIKPYLPYADCHEDAVGGFADEHRWDEVDVQWDSMDIKECIPTETCKAVEQILRQDPRASYNKNDDYIYGMSYNGYDIRFKAGRNKITVIGVCRIGCGFKKIK